MYAIVLLEGVQELVAVLPEQSKGDAAATQKCNSDDSNDEGGIAFLGLFGGGCDRCFHWILQTMTE